MDKPEEQIPLTSGERMRAHDNIRALLQAHREGGPKLMDTVWDKLFGPAPKEQVSVGQKAIDDVSTES